MIMSTYSTSYRFNLTIPSSPAFLGRWVNCSSPNLTQITAKTKQASLFASLRYSVKGPLHASYIIPLSSTCCPLGFHCLCRFITRNLCVLAVDQKVFPSTTLKELRGLPVYDSLIPSVCNHSSLDRMIFYHLQALNQITALVRLAGRLLHHPLRTSPNK